MGRFWSILFLMVPILGVLCFVWPMLDLWPMQRHWLPENVNDHGGVIDNLFYFILVLTGVLVARLGAFDRGRFGRCLVRVLVFVKVLGKHVKIIVVLVITFSIVFRSVRLLPLGCLYDLVHLAVEDDLPMSKLVPTLILLHVHGWVVVGC